MVGTPSGDRASLPATALDRNLESTGGVHRAVVRLREEGRGVAGKGWVRLRTITRFLEQVQRFGQHRSAQEESRRLRP